MSTAPLDAERRERLLHDGFCRFPSVLSAEMLEALCSAADRMLETLSPKVAERTRAQGSLLPTTGDPQFADLIAYPAALAALKCLGFPHPTFTDGYVISKPGGSPRLFWHYDWFAWEDPYSHRSIPPQVFAMYYLSDTKPENGCLRVIPGSHVRHNPLHDLLREPHSDALGRAEDAGEKVEFSTRPDEIDVPVVAGDLLIGDARLLHAAHANQTTHQQTLSRSGTSPILRGCRSRSRHRWPRRCNTLRQTGRKRHERSTLPFCRGILAVRSRTDVSSIARQKSHETTESLKLAW